MATDIAERDPATDFGAHAGGFAKMVTTITPERWFVTVGGIFGLLWVFITPPFQVPDEPNHFARAWQIATGGFVGERRGDASGGTLPSSIVRLIVDVGPGGRFAPEQRAHAPDFVRWLDLPLAPDQRDFVSFPNTVLYSPLCYLPQAVGVAVGAAFDLAPLLLLYLGRAANVCAWLFLGWAALRHMPIARWPMLLLLLMPMSLFEAASLSADPLTNGVSFWFIALCLRTALDPTQVITGGRYLRLVLGSAAVALCKPVYYPLTALLWLIPPERFGSTQRRRRGVLIAFAVGLGAAAFWQIAIRDLYVPMGSSHHSPGAQLQYILHHPLHFARVVQATIAINGRDYFTMFIGTLGWLDLSLPSWLTQMYWGVLVASLLATDTLDIATVDLRPSARLLVLAILMTLIAGLLISIYAVWDPVGYDVIFGVQGRYFIPGSVLLWVACHQRRVQVRSPKFALAIAGFTIFSALVTTNALIQRYY